MTTSCPGFEVLESIASGEEPSGGAGEHVESCPACSELVEEIRANLALSSDLKAIAPLAEAREDEVPPDLRDRGYSVIRELFRGGQGVVYLCEHGPTRRRVAVKTMLRESLSSRRRRARFEREAELIAQLRHPNVVTVFDSGVSDDGQAFIAMEYIDGGPLDLDGKAPASRREERETLALFTRICAGVAAAHRRGVIHRDLKPQNILLDAEGEPHVLDFGVAKALERTDSQRTAAGEFLGTIAYAAPEQLVGPDYEVDVRTDVYALGLILYEMLTGVRARPRDTSFGEVLESVRSGWVRRASSVCPRIHDDLDAVLGKALTPSMEGRYATVEALREDVDRYLGGMPVEAKRGRRWYLARKFVARHRVSIGVAGAFVGVLIGASIVNLAQLRTARLEAAKANSIRMFLEDTLASVDPEAPGADPTIRAALDEAVHWVEIALADEPEVAASIRGTIGNSYRALGRFDDADTQISQALKTRLALFGRRHADVAESLNQLGLLRRDQGMLIEADSLMREALEIRRRRFGGLHAKTALSLMNLAGVAQRDDRPGDAEVLYQEALDIRLALHGQRPHADVAMCLYLLAEVAEQDGNPARAVSLHTRALEMRREVLHELHPDLARSKFARGRLGILAGESGVATMLQESVDSIATRLGERHWRVGEARMWFARALLREGDAERGNAQATLALEILDTALGADDALTREARSLVDPPDDG